MHLGLIFLEFLSEMDLEVLGQPSKISAERAVLKPPTMLQSCPQ